MTPFDPDQIVLVPLAGETSGARLTIGNSSVDISGIQLRAAYKLENTDPVSGYLFFSDDGDLFEEVLSITLTDPDLRILDRAWIGAPYGNAQWDGAEMAGPGRINFDLAGNGRWRLTVLSRPQWRLPLPGAGGAVWRGLNLRRHFRIEQITRT